MPDSKNRFSTRVSNYVKYRPGYPPQVVDLLRAECGLRPEWVVADIGSGTGLLTRLFLEAGCQVYGVEPNAEMRQAGEQLLAGYQPRFTSLPGSAEETGLPDASVDLITAGQAFHWFDPTPTGTEFRRILRPGGWAALIWNERLLDTTPFLRGYEALLQTYATDYNEINHRNTEDDPLLIPAFFGGPYETVRFPNQQVFDFDGVRGRMESSSYIPEPGHPNYEAMMTGLREIFDLYQQEGRVIFEYTTVIMYGRLQ